MLRSVYTNHVKESNSRLIEFINKNREKPRHGIEIDTAEIKLIVEDGYGKLMDSWLFYSHPEEVIFEKSKTFEDNLKNFINSELERESEWRKQKEEEVEKTIQRIKFLIQTFNFKNEPEFLRNDWNKKGQIANYDNEMNNFLGKLEVEEEKFKLFNKLYEEAKKYAIELQDSSPSFTIIERREMYPDEIVINVLENYNESMRDEKERRLSKIAELRKSTNECFKILELCPENEHQFAIMKVEENFTEKLIDDLTILNNSLLAKVSVFNARIERERLCAEIEAYDTSKTITQLPTGIESEDIEKLKSVAGRLKEEYEKRIEKLALATIEMINTLKCSLFISELTIKPEVYDKAALSMLQKELGKLIRFYEENKFMIKLVYRRNKDQVLLFDLEFNGKKDEFKHSNNSYSKVKNRIGKTEAELRIWNGNFNGRSINEVINEENAQLLEMRTKIRIQTQLQILQESVKKEKEGKGDFPSKKNSKSANRNQLMEKQKTPQKKKANMPSTGKSNKEPIEEEDQSEIIRRCLKLNSPPKLPKYIFNLPRTIKKAIREKQKQLETLKKQGWSSEHDWLMTDEPGEINSIVETLQIDSDDDSDMKDVKPVIRKNAFKKRYTIEDEVKLLKIIGASNWHPYINGERIYREMVKHPKGFPGRSMDGLSCRVRLKLLKNLENYGFGKCEREKYKTPQIRSKSNRINPPFNEDFEDYDYTL